MSLTWPVLSTRKFCRQRGQPMSTHLRLEIPVDVAKLVQLVDAHEHLGGVKPRVLLLEHARVVQQRPEVSPWNVFLRVSLGPLTPHQLTIAKKTWSLSWKA